MPTYGLTNTIPESEPTTPFIITNKKRKRNSNPRIKTSYFGTPPINSNPNNNDGDTPFVPPNDKIVFLVTDIQSDDNKSNKRPKPNPDTIIDTPPPISNNNSDNNTNNNPNNNNDNDPFNDLFKFIFFGIPPGGNPNAPRKKKPQQDEEVPSIIQPIECKNPLCNHKTLEEDSEPPTVINIDPIENIDDLITLGKAFHCKKQTMYRGLNLRLMNNLVVPLVELRDMIGMSDVKAHVVDQILFFLQGLNSNTKCNACQDCAHGLPCIQSSNEMLHTVITGPPGVGKTCLGRIMGKVYNAMGILSTGTFHEVTRVDFVAGYLGQTAIKTQKLIDSCKGGVMFIDEAYSMGSKEKRDSFSKEALDTLNKNLSDNRDMLCIIAGYEKDLDECFFSGNDGLKRRFTFRYNVAEYDYNELLDIFKLKVEKEGWTIDFNSDPTPPVNMDEAISPKQYSSDDLLNLFRSHKDSFPYSGGDVETYFLQCKIVHGRRMPTIRKCLSFGDLEKGFEKFTKNRKTKKTKKCNDEESRPNMYTF